MMIKAKRRFQNTSSTASLRLPLTKRFLTHGQEWKAEPVHATRHSSRLGAKQLALIGLRKHFWPAPHLGSKTFCSPSAKWFYAWAGFQWCADLDYLSFDPGITWLWWGGHLEAASWICDIVGAPKERQGCCAQALWHQSFWISQESWKIQVLSKWNAGCLWIFGVLCGIMLPSPWTMHFSLSMFLGLVQKCWIIVWQFLHCKGLATNTCFNWLNKHWLLPSMQVGHRSSDQRCVGLCISVMLWSSMVNFLGFGLWKGNTRTPGNM